MQRTLSVEEAWPKRRGQREIGNNLEVNTSGIKLRVRKIRNGCLEQRQSSMELPQR